MISNNTTIEFPKQDGVIETSLHVRRVDRRHFTNFLCQAKNALGEDQLLMRLDEASHSASAGLRSQLAIAIFAAAIVVQRLF